MSVSTCFELFLFIWSDKRQAFSFLLNRDKKSRRCHLGKKWLQNWFDLHCPYHLRQHYRTVCIVRLAATLLNHRRTFICCFFSSRRLLAGKWEPSGRLGKSIGQRDNNKSLRSSGRRNFGGTRFWMLLVFVSMSTGIPRNSINRLGPIGRWGSQIARTDFAFHLFLVKYSLPFECGTAYFDFWAWLDLGHWWKTFRMKEYKN